MTMTSRATQGKVLQRARKRCTNALKRQEEAREAVRNALAFLENTSADVAIAFNRLERAEQIQEPTKPLEIDSEDT